jgi:hypothetical protein
MLVSRAFLPHANRHAQQHNTCDRWPPSFSAFLKTQSAHKLRRRTTCQCHPAFAWQTLQKLGHPQRVQHYMLRPENIRETTGPFRAARPLCRGCTMVPSYACGGSLGTAEVVGRHLRTTHSCSQCARHARSPPRHKPATYLD